MKPVSEMTEAELKAELAAVDERNRLNELRRKVQGERNFQQLLRESAEPKKPKGFWGWWANFGTGSSFEDGGPF